MPTGGQRNSAVTWHGGCATALALLTLSACGEGYTSLGKETAGGGVDSGIPGADSGLPDGARRRPPILSGLPWPSGTNVADPVEITAWATYRGRPNDVALVMTNYATWSTLTQPETTLNDFRDFPGVLVIAQAMWAGGDYNENVDPGQLAACAAGDFDGYWRNFGVTLTKYGRQSSIVRLGWQFNSNDVPWQARDKGAWMACFRHIVSAIRERAPEVLIDWSMGAHGTETPVGGHAFDVYPGDDFVDIVGIDAFDMWPASPTEEKFLDQCHGPEGICTVVDFARAHGKLFSSGQWCVVECFPDGGDGNDNPFYIERMHRVFAENAGIVGYETYFDDTASKAFCTSLYDTAKFPLSSQRYRTLWGK